MLLLTCDSVEAGHLIDILTKPKSHRAPLYALSNWSVAAESQLLISNDAIDTAPWRHLRTTDSSSGASSCSELDGLLSLRQPMAKNSSDAC
jgi:hypothetical protein